MGPRGEEGRPGLAAGLCFAREIITHSLVAELSPLFEKNQEETGSDFIQGLDIDVDGYVRLEQMNMTRLYLARSGPFPIAYCLFILGRSPISGQMTANQNLLYVHPEARGIGKRFVLWAEQELQRDGVHVVYQSFNVNDGDEEANQKIVGFYKSIGYRKSSEVFAKKLGD